MEYIAQYMKVLTFLFSILAFLFMMFCQISADSLSTFEPEKSLIRYRFLKEQKPHDRESLYDELMSLRNWVLGELKQLKVSKQPVSSKIAIPDEPEPAFVAPVISSKPERKPEAKLESNFQVSSKVEPEALEALEKEAQSAFRMKDYARAAVLYTDLLRMSPRDEFFRSRARCFKRLNRFTEAMQDYEKLDILSEPPTVGIELVRAYEQVDKTSKAIGLGEQIYSKYPEFERIKLTLGLLYKKEKQYEKASPLIEEFLATNPKEPLALLEYGNLMEKMGKWAEGLEIYNHLLEVDPGHRLAIRNRGNVLYRLKQYDDASRDLQKSGYLHIPWVQKLYEASLERSAKQAQPPALPSPGGILAKIVKKRPGALPSKKPMIVSQLPETVTKITKPVTPPRKPEKPVPAVEPKSIVESLDIPTSKVEKQALNSNSLLTATSENSPGMEAFRARKYHEAADLLRMEVRKNPLSLQLSETYLQALQRVKNHEEIINEYERLQKVLPGYVDFDLEKKFFQLSLNKFSTVLDGITQTHPSAYAQFLRSLAYNGLGQGEEARTALEKAASIDSRFAQLDAGRLLWLVRVKNYQDAYYLGKELITNPSDWMYYELARITWALGNGVESVLYLTKTVQIDPKNAEAFFLLAKIMHSLKRFEDRDVFIQKAQVLDPNSIEIRLWNQSLEK